MMPAETLALVLNKQDLINMLKGIGPPAELDGHDIRGSTLVKSKGNQWNEDWEWDEYALSGAFTIQQLHQLYLKVKEAKDE